MRPKCRYVLAAIAARTLATSTNNTLLSRHGQPFSLPFSSSGHIKVHAAPPWTQHQHQTAAFPKTKLRGYRPFLSPACSPEVRRCLAAFLVSQQRVPCAPLAPSAPLPPPPPLLSPVPPSPQSRTTSCAVRYRYHYPLPCIRCSIPAYVRCRMGYRCSHRRY